MFDGCEAGARRSLSRAAAQGQASKAGTRQALN
jgi:hypothetical protein